MESLEIISNKIHGGLDLNQMFSLALIHAIKEYNYAWSAQSEDASTT